MLRRMGVVLAAVVVAMALPHGATAGGMSSFEFKKNYYVAGERAEGQTAFWISKKDRHLLERTWHAYLIPRGEWIEPPGIPQSAVPIGTVTFDGLARISFIVPELEPGGYSVGICDRPCRHGYVGDLGGGWIHVVSSAEEARLRAKIDRLSDQLSRAHWKLQGTVDRHRERLSDLQAQIDGIVRESERQQDELLDSALAALAKRPQAQTSWFDRAGWVVAVLALAALTLVHGRRRKRPVPAAAASPNGHAAPVTEDLRWKIEAAEEEEEHTPVGVG